MFKYFSDKIMVRLATKFGFPDESLEKEQELIDLKKALIEEKLKSSENIQSEVVTLRAKVAQLHEEKTFMLEQEIQRLKYENHLLRNGNEASNQLELGRPNSEVKTIEYKDVDV